MSYFTGALCEVCNVTVFGSHYHCPNCWEQCSMMGHLSSAPNSGYRCERKPKPKPTHEEPVRVPTVAEQLATAQQRIADLLAHVESQAYELFTVMADNGRLQGTVSDQASVLEDQNKIIAQKDYEIASLSYDGTHINWYQRCITAEKTLRLAQNDLATAQQQVRDLRAALEACKLIFTSLSDSPYCDLAAETGEQIDAALAATAEPEAER